MNLDSGPAATSITPIAMTTAAIMTRISSAMPTAVMTESSEKTTSSSTIWIRTPRKLIAFDAVAGPVTTALEPLVDLGRRLGQEEQAAADEDQVTAGELHARRS